MDFRSLSICPEQTELIKGYCPVLRKNIVDGRYDGIDQYLDIQFRLLREDFIRPLRERISEFIKTKNKPTAANDKELNVYRNVRISENGTCEFDCTPFKEADWEDNKRLEIGSLVCLTVDDFETIIFATIKGGRNRKKLAGIKNGVETGKGELKLKFEFGKNDFKTDDVYVMIEAPDLFEAYRYNLEVLQKFGPDNFPLTKFIVELNNHIPPPSYVTNEKKAYKLSNDLFKTELFSVDILDDDSWPDHKSFGLNPSQFEAFRAALTQQLTIIQGPPGTGKTYVGLRIVQALLSNNCPLPILVVCYTNHALDQFLEGILDFCKRNEVIRLGGRSKSDKLLTLSSRRCHNKKGIKVIGMTTTGAAKFRDLIEKKRPKITIVEEAAEVLEAHIVTALTKHIDHLILIGDHKQLRPKCKVHELTKDYKMEISLFERFIMNEMKHYQLMEQHRMRPCISALLVPHIYDCLLNHPSVEEYDDVQGISRNMFFINHAKGESPKPESRSLINHHEAAFIVQLASYLIQQGYLTSQVTILAMYGAQLQVIRSLIDKDPILLDGVHATTVDGFQGEENDIILVSFVRSNNAKYIGFLKTQNRINVGLSRAKKGLYCIGNFENMASQCKSVKGEQFPWNNLVKQLKKQKDIGNSLELCCRIHGTKKTVKTADDFSKTLCSRVCNIDLPCGHKCKRPCHASKMDEEHLYLFQNCTEKCIKTCVRGHPCPAKNCHPLSCDDCMVIVDKVRQDCQHTVRVACSQDPSEAVCNETVEAESPCGHMITINCSDAKDRWKLLSLCQAPCGITLKCGHLCKGSCIRCIRGRFHVSCEEVCNRTQNCDHLCPKACRTNHQKSTGITIRNGMSVAAELNKKVQFCEEIRLMLAEQLAVIQNALYHSDYALTAKKLHWLESISEIASIEINTVELFRNCFTEVIDEFYDRLRVAAKFISCYDDCEQQNHDILTEITFLKMIANVMVQANTRELCCEEKTNLNMLLLMCICY